MAIKVKRKKSSTRTKPKREMKVIPGPIFLNPKIDHCCWNFWRDGVTQSFIQSWLACKEQTRLAYVEGWQSFKVPLAMEFGSCVQYILSHLYSKSKPQQSWQAYLGDYEIVWQEENPMATKYQLEQQERVYGLAQAVLPSYIKRWRGDWKGGRYPSSLTIVKPKEWLGLEHEFEIPFVFCDGQTVNIRGAFDGLFNDSRIQPWLFETKCLSMIDEVGIEDMLPRDFQVMLYLHAARSVLGKVPKGVLYNIIRRPGQRLGSSEKLLAFFKRVERDVENPKRWDHYFIRMQMEITRKELDNWVHHTLRPILYAIRDWWEGRAPHYATDSALITKYGRAPLYDLMVYDDASSCFKRKKPFNELEYTA